MNLTVLTKMEISDRLEEDGWHLSNEALQKITENGAITNAKVVEKKALDMDLREIGSPCFPDDLLKGKLDSLSGHIVVQVQKVRNVSAPKANEDSRAAPRMLKLTLTDGTTICHAVELQTISRLSMNTPPGTKLFLKGEAIPIMHGLILIQPSNAEVLGGLVAPLVEKWELNRSLAKHTRGCIGEEGGPPSWIPFGQKILRSNLHDNNFKSLDGAAAKENAEFEAQRQDAIAEAARGGARKVFGGGNKPLMDRNVQAILDMGYSLDQAEAALRQTRNNVDRALRNLQRQHEGGGGRGGREEKGGRRRGWDEDTGGAASGGPKPSAKVSLFDFLEDKLPTQNEKENETSVPSRHNQFSGMSRNYDLREDSREQGKTYDRGSRGGRRGRGGGYNTDPRDRERGGGGGHREDRNRSVSNSTISNQNQKPPRFQNQQRYQENSCSWPYHDHEDTSSRLSRLQISSGYDDFGNQGRQANSTYNGIYSGANSHYSQHSLYDTIPDIPEFPYKDTTCIPPLLSHNSSGFFGGGGGYMSSPSIGHYGATVGKELQAETSASPPTLCWKWKIGEKCMAKYWEDNMYYNAEVTGVSKRTCVVRFLEYGNFEEVLQDDCIPITEGDTEQRSQHTSMLGHTNTSHQPNYNNHNGATRNNHFSGILEFRRGGTRPYIKSSEFGGQRKPHVTQSIYIPPGQRGDIEK